LRVGCWGNGQREQREHSKAGIHGTPVDLVNAWHATHAC
jgi:hypothetical protein